MKSPLEFPPVFCHVCGKELDGKDSHVPMYKEDVRRTFGMKRVITNSYVFECSGCKSKTKVAYCVRAWKW